MLGGIGDDHLDGGLGGDALSGGDGDDTLFIDADDSVICGGNGTDRAFVKTTSGVTLDLTASAIEFAFGNDGADVFTASGASSVTMGGEGGNDTLTGGNGNDRLIGGEGDDTLVGGTGLDAAEYSGQSTDYAITADGQGGYIVVDNNLSDGDDGTDHITGIERLVFTDRTVHVEGPNSNPDAAGETWRVKNFTGAITIRRAHLWSAAGLSRGRSPQRQHQFERRSLAGQSALSSGGAEIRTVDRPRVRRASRACSNGL